MPYDNTMPCEVVDAHVLKLAAEMVEAINAKFAAAPDPKEGA